jgi:hypothetical protein
VNSSSSSVTFGSISAGKKATTTRVRADGAIVALDRTAELKVKLLTVVLAGINGEPPILTCPVVGLKDISVFVTPEGVEPKALLERVTFGAEILRTVVPYGK